MAAEVLRPFIDNPSKCLERENYSRCFSVEDRSTCQIFSRFALCFNIFSYRFCFDQLYFLFQKDLFTDLSVNVKFGEQSRTFQVHKNIMCASSQFFLKNLVQDGVVREFVFKKPMVFHWKLFGFLPRPTRPSKVWTLRCTLTCLKLTWPLYMTVTQSSMRKILFIFNRPLRWYYFKLKFEETSETLFG